MRSVSRLGRVLVALAAALAALPVPLPSSARAGGSPPNTDASALAAALGLPGLDELEATLERPLFSPTRKPPPRGIVLAPEPDEEPRAETPPFALAGVVMSGAMRVAMLRHPNRRIEIARQGDDFGGWRIERVAPREVVVSRGKARVKLQIFEDKRKRGVAE